MIKVKVNNEYKDIVKIFCGGTLQKEIIKVWSREAQDYVYESSVKYTGTLPITITADGNALLDYRIYGSRGGVGVAMENLFDISSATANKYILPANGMEIDYNEGAYMLSDYIDVSDVDTITISSTVGNVGSSTGAHLNLYDANKNWIRGYVAYSAGPIHSKKTFTADVSNVSYVRVDYATQYLLQNSLVPGSTAPTEYIPYGYKLPMTVQSVNLFDKNAQDVNNGFISKTRLNSDGTTQNQYNFNVSEYIAVRPETSYYFGNISTNANFGPSECFYDSEKNFISSYTPRFENSFVATTPTNAAYVRVSYYIDNSEQMITKGTEPPLEYIPYIKQSAPVYIGENQLDAIGEYRDYVDKSSGKIVRHIREYTFTGNETFNFYSQYAYGTCWCDLRYYAPPAYSPLGNVSIYCSHFTAINNNVISFWIGNETLDNACNFENDTSNICFRSQNNFQTAEECKAYFKQQYDNGTPVKIWYILQYTLSEDPPVPLPEIPTIDGTTIIDYDGTPKPSQMYVKYRR